MFQGPQRPSRGGARACATSVWMEAWIQRAEVAGGRLWQRSWARQPGHQWLKPRSPEARRVNCPGPKPQLCHLHALGNFKQVPFLLGVSASQGGKQRQGQHLFGHGLLCQVEQTAQGQGLVQVPRAWLPSQCPLGQQELAVREGVPRRQVLTDAEQGTETERGRPSEPKAMTPGRQGLAIKFPLPVTFSWAPGHPCQVTFLGPLPRP